MAPVTSLPRGITTEPFTATGTSVRKMNPVALVSVFGAHFVHQREQDPRTGGHGKSGSLPCSGLLDNAHGDGSWGGTPASPLVGHWREPPGGEWSGCRG